MRFLLGQAHFASKGYDVACVAGNARNTRNIITFARAAGASVQIIHKPCEFASPHGEIACLLGNILLYGMCYNGLYGIVCYNELCMTSAKIVSLLSDSV
jgi:hypothetical protein